MGQIHGFLWVPQKKYGEKYAGDYEKTGGIVTYEYYHDQ